MNLAPWKFRNILSSDGGPVRKIEVRRISSPILNSVFEAHAELDTATLTCVPVKDLKIYGTADGSGTSIYRNQARYKSISEALERWAFYEVAVSQMSSQFGFSVDRSTTGMAAFPGFTDQIASDNAFYEAVERWSLCAWWEGRLRSTRLSDPIISSTGNFIPQGVEIQIGHLLGGTPIPQGRTFSVVVLWSEISGHDRVCYAFSCASTLEKAIKRASVELDRNRRVLGDLPSPSEVLDIGEKRLLFFSSPEGHGQFMDRVKQSFSLSQVISKAPAVVTNGPIPGAWTRYCQVWRSLFEPVSREHESDRIDYFLF